MTSLSAILLSAVLSACSASNGGSAESAVATTDEVSTPIPVFAADSAYAYVAAQTAMGPRTPGSKAHAQCCDWMVSMLNKFGADTVWIQSGSIDNHRGGTAAINNVFARFGTSNSRRILLLAHYDTRPWADEDPDASKHTQPIDGANDGASGVAVLLEVARQIGLNRPSVGIDILMADAEDSGISDSSDPESDLTWCLGTQFFADNLPYPGKLPEAAILLDMVGGHEAVFTKEYFSTQYSKDVCDAFRKAAEQAGFGTRFPDREGGAVNDDHIPLIRAGIKAIDIIECSNPRTGSFNPTWHTMADNLDNIDPNTLGAVGQTVLQYLYTR